MQSMLISSPTLRLLLHTLARSFLGERCILLCLFPSPFQPSFQSLVLQGGVRVSMRAHAYNHL